MATMPIGAMAMGSRARKPAAENPLAPGAANISLYGFDTGHSCLISKPIIPYAAYVNEIITYAAYVNIHIRPVCENSRWKFDGQAPHRNDRRNPRQAHRRRPPRLRHDRLF